MDLAARLICLKPMKREIQWLNALVCLPLQSTIMQMRRIPQVGLVCIGLCAGLSGYAAQQATNSLVWDKTKDSVTADVRGLELTDLLTRIATETGWQVFVEPGTEHTASTKFKNLSSGEALRLLLGDINFALVPQTNAPSRLYVFRTGMDKATQYIRALKKAAGAKRIPNELIVKLKPGGNINELARKLGAKVIGCIDSLGVCRLQFADAAAADAAYAQLIQSDDVAAVDYNYSIDRPTTPNQFVGGSASLPQLTLNPPPDSGRIIVGMPDTKFEPMCGDLNNFVLKQISVVGDAPPTSGNASPTHATAMAEAILRGVAATTKGSTSVQILPVNVYGSNPTTSTYDVAAGIVAAVNNGANVINLSLGGEGDSQFLQSLIQAVLKRGIPVFAAAGNQPVTTPFYPAAYPGVVAVTATDGGNLASYANRGSFVSAAAPGSEVFCYNGQSYIATGTSASSAYASGMAAGLADTTGKKPSDVVSTLESKLPVPKNK